MVGIAYSSNQLAILTVLSNLIGVTESFSLLKVSFFVTIFSYLVSVWSFKIGLDVWLISGKSEASFHIPVLLSNEQELSAATKRLVIIFHFKLFFNLII